MEVIAESKLTKDLLETNIDADIFEDPVPQNRRVSVFDVSSSRTTSSQIPSLPSSGKVVLKKKVLSYSFALGKGFEFF